MALSISRLHFNHFMPLFNRKMSKNRKRQALETDEEYVVEKILDHRVNPDSLNSEFLVKWKDYPASENTWEPVENVFHLIVLIREYVERKHEDLKKRVKGFLSEEATARLPKFKVLDKEILQKLKDPQEYVPEGNERIGTGRIISEMTSDAGVPLWNVVFENQRYLHLIRKSVMLYYWPHESCLFLTMWASKIEAIKRFEAQQEKSEQNAGESHGKGKKMRK